MGRAAVPRVAMTPSTATDTPAEGGGPAPLPPVVDWAVGAVAALVGLVSLVGGIALTVVADRDIIAEMVAEGSIESTVFTETEVVEVSLSVATWTGMGLLATGAILLVGAVAYVVLRRRTRRRAEGGEPQSEFFANATLGAVIALLLSFVPFSPAVGGAVAGYLEAGESQRTVGVGGLSGLLLVSPLLVVLAFLTGGLVFGALEAASGGMALLLGAVLLLALMLVAVTGAGVGALGGWVGGALAERRA